jgi:phosphoribosylamine--glycine ligase
MKVLLLGSGGREHALSWKISQSSILDELFIAPGNAGTKQFGKNVNLSIVDFEAIKKFVLDNQINMLVVGPEEPLVLGIYDFFQADPELKNCAVIGPSKEGAKLEGSKHYAKEFMARHRIPTAKYGTFTEATLSEGINFLRGMAAPYVLKADGLAAG